MKGILKYPCTWKFWKELLVIPLGMVIAILPVIGWKYLRTNE